MHISIEPVEQAELEKVVFVLPFTQDNNNPYSKE